MTLEEARRLAGHVVRVENWKCEPGCTCLLGGSCCRGGDETLGVLVGGRLDRGARTSVFVRCLCPACREVPVAAALARIPIGCIARATPEETALYHLASLP